MNTATCVKCSSTSVRTWKICLAYVMSGCSLILRSMLTRRLVTRPGTIRSQLQRRFIIPYRSQSQAPGLPRPNTWLEKIRFRADGKPRSKLIALGFGEYPFYIFL